MSKKQQEQEQEQESDKPKEKKVKVIYYDDGSTIADMSRGKSRPPRTKATFREKARTYFATVKRMILPMLCVLASFLLIYIFLLAITGHL